MPVYSTVLVVAADHEQLHRGLDLPLLDLQLVRGQGQISGGSASTAGRSRDPVSPGTLVALDALQQSFFRICKKLKTRFSFNLFIPWEILENCRNCFLFFSKLKMKY